MNHLARESHLAGNEAGAGGASAEAADKQTTTRPLAKAGTERTVASTPDVRRVEPPGR